MVPFTASRPARVDATPLLPDACTGLVNALLLQESRKSMQMRRRRFLIMYCRFRNWEMPPDVTNEEEGEEERR
jgi:hypothetical protein